MRHLLLILLPFIIWGCKTTSDKELLTDSIESFRQDYQIQGLSVAIIKDGEPYIVSGFGKADEERQANKETVFHVASIQKSITAIAIMQLVEQNKLSLDDSVFDLLPDFQPKWLTSERPEFLVRDLLTHQGPLNGLNFASTVSVIENDPEYIDPEAMMRKLPANLSKDWLVPKDSLAYNNQSFALAGLIVERLSGQSYSEYLTQHIYGPLNMQSSHAFLPRQAPENLAQAFSEGQMVELPVLYDGTMPAGAMIASAQDMTNYMQALLKTINGENVGLIKPETMAQMTRPQNADKWLDQQELVGFGFFLPNTGTPIVEHGGDLPGFHTQMVLAPEYNSAIYMAVNDDNGGGIVNAVAFSLLLQIIQDQGFEFDDEQSFYKEAANIEPVLGQFYHGHGTFGTFGEVVVTQEQNNLVATINGESLIMKKVKPNLYQVDQLYLWSMDQKQGYWLLDEDLDYFGYLLPIAEQAVTDQWEQRAGKYGFIVDDEFIGASIEIDNQWIWLRLLDQEHGIPMAIVNNNTLVNQSEGRGAMAVVQWQDDGSISLLGVELPKLSD